MITINKPPDHLWLESTELSTTEQIVYFARYRENVKLEVTLSRLASNYLTYVTKTLDFDFGVTHFTNSFFRAHRNKNICTEILEQYYRVDTGSRNGRTSNSFWGNFLYHLEKNERVKFNDFALIMHFFCFGEIPPENLLPDLIMQKLLRKKVN